MTTTGQSTGTGWQTVVSDKDGRQSWLIDDHLIPVDAQDGPHQEALRERSSPQHQPAAATVDTDAVDELWERCPASGKTFEESLIESGVISSRELAEAYSRQYLLPLFDPPADEPLPVDPGIAKILPARICLDAMIAPLADDGVSIDVAIVSPEALRAQEEIYKLSGRIMRPLFATLTTVEALLHLLYGDEENELAAIRDRTKVDIAETLEPTVAVKNVDVEAREYIEKLFEHALERRATDILIDPIENRARVRLRIGGSLVPYASPETECLTFVTAQLKKLAKIHLDNSGQPREGSIRLRHGNRQVSVDVLTHPTVAGETFVLKIHARDSVPRKLAELGLGQVQMRQIADALDGAPGMMIVCGPRRSGKRTTLYACLQHLNSQDKSLWSVEEAIRMTLPGVNQFSARPEHGISLSEAVDAVIRREPDVLMLSDLRESDLAKACFRAVLDKRTVLVGMQARGTTQAIAKLVKLGISTRDIESYVRVFVGQRIVRRLCSSCRTERTYGPHELLQLGLSLDAIASITEHGTLSGFEATGCEKCRNTGFRGGVVLFERFGTGAELVKEVKSNTGHVSSTILDAATVLSVKAGIVSLHDALN